MNIIANDGGLIKAYKPIKISFRINYETKFGESISLVGSVPEVGLWKDPRRAQM